MIDHGRVIAQGTPRELKAATGSQLLEVTLVSPHAGAPAAVAAFALGKVNVSDDGRRLRGVVRSESGLATAVLRALDQAGVLVDDIAIHQPSLDDVFATLTGADTAAESMAIVEGVLGMTSRRPARSRRAAALRPPAVLVERRPGS